MLGLLIGKYTYPYNYVDIIYIYRKTSENPPPPVASQLGQSATVAQLAVIW